MTHQNDEKDLSNMTENFVGGVKLMVNSLKKGSGYVKAPINNRGMTHQNDEKDISNTTEYFVGGVKLAE